MFFHLFYGPDNGLFGLLPGNYLFIELSGCLQPVLHGSITIKSALFGNIVSLVGYHLMTLFSRQALCSCGFHVARAVPRLAGSLSTKALFSTAIIADVCFFFAILTSPGVILTG